MDQRTALLFTCFLAALAVCRCKPLPFDLIIIGPHHKTGTIQTQCIMHEWAAQHDWPFAAGKMTPNYNVWNEVSGALSDLKAYEKATGFTRPYVMATWKTRHECEEEGCPPDSLLRCPVGSVRNCSLSIPSARLLHAYRNPMSTLFSSMAYHTQPSIPNMENWLGHNARKAMVKLARRSVFGGEFIHALVREHMMDSRSVSLHSLMHTLPFDKCLLLNFLLGEKELREAAFIRRAFEDSPQVINVRFEDLSHKYNETVAKIYEFFRTDESDMLTTTEKFVDSVQFCDPYTWTANDAAHSDHLTSHHTRSFTPEEALDVLASVPDVWEAMCGFCRDLGYNDDGCERC